MQTERVTPGAGRIRASAGLQTPRATLRHGSAFEAIPLGLATQTYGFDPDRLVVDALATTDLSGEVVAVAAIHGPEGTRVAGWRGEPAVPRFAIGIDGVLEVAHWDLDTDGDLDTVYTAGDSLGVLVAHETAGIDCMMVLPTDGNVRSVTAGDFDPDGELDLAAVGDDSGLTFVPGPLIP
jgi:hypothetical protein